MYLCECMHSLAAQTYAHRAQKMSGPSELELQVFVGSPACSMGAGTHILHS